MEKLIGIINKDGWVQVEDSRKFQLPFRGKDKDGYPEVLIDAKIVGGDESFYRQSIQPFIGMKCEFFTNNGIYGYDFKLI